MGNQTVLILIGLESGLDVQLVEANFVLLGGVDVDFPVVSFCFNEIFMKKKLTIMVVISYHISLWLWFKNSFRSYFITIVV